MTSPDFGVLHCLVCLAQHKQLRPVLAPRSAGVARAPDTQDCCPVCFLLAKRNGNLTKRPPNRGDLAGAEFLVNPTTLVDATILACEGDQCSDALLRIIQPPRHKDDPAGVIAQAMPQVDTPTLAARMRTGLVAAQADPEAFLCNRIRCIGVMICGRLKR